jgi:endoglucanase
MKHYPILLAALFMLVSCGRQSGGYIHADGKGGYIHADGKGIVNGEGEEIQLKGIGLGGWMLQEPYMLKLSGVSPAQYDIKKKITDLIGKERCDEFYNAWLSNMITKRDIDSLRAWGFNSIRLPMHYNLFTPPVDDEPVAGQVTWLDRGFQLTDSLLKWCGESDIWLILDLHAAPGGQGNDIPIADIDTTKPRLWESAPDRLKTVALWGKLAGRYRSESWIGGYDLINETNYPLEGNVALREFLSDITKAIREADTHHMVFIEGNHFATDFTGLTPPWDSNMAYSFHKYWNPTTIETIQQFLDLRDNNNVPLWMGESGENTNDWYKSAVELFETNSIGWAWWTIKKLDSESGIMNVSVPDGYQKIIDYWKGNGPAPEADDAYKTLMQLADNIKIENCSVNYGVLRALFAR